MNNFQAGPPLLARPPSVRALEPGVEGAGTFPAAQESEIT